MLPPSNVIDAQGVVPRDVTTNSRGLPPSEIPTVPCGTEVAASSCHVARYREEFDETIRTVSEPECSKRRIDSAGTGSTRSVPDGRSRQGFSKGSASLQSLVRRRSRRHGTSLPSEVELSSRQVVYPAVPSDLFKDIGGGGGGGTAMFRNEEEARTATPTSTLVYATSSAQPSTSRTDNNLVGQDVSTSASNVATTTTGSNVTSTTNGGRFGNVPVSLARTTSVAKAPGPSVSSTWNNSAEQESDYVVDPVQGNAYYKGQFLGKGGFARVYLMTDVSNGNQYACKIIPKNRMQRIHMQKIAREIMIHKELNHVNVVQMHHYFEDNLNVYMLLEACPRKSLMHVLKYRGKVTEPEARYYMKQMVTGVAYIHSQKVVHRDLKPGNMFLSDRMIVKIGDFGLATRPDGQRRRVTICGTPNYIAPEVLYKQAYSYEADVWALGCILYALLVGQPPFDTATLKETYARICNNHYREVDDSIASRSGQDLIRWLLQSNPELRPSLERVKEHVYLTKEYVPASLPHTCCYQMPPASIIEPPSSPSSVSTVARNPEIKAQTIPTQQAQQQSQYQQHLLNRSQKSLQKESKVSSWLVRKLPKLPRFRQRLSSVLCPDHKKTSFVAQSVQMHRALEACVPEMKRNNACNPPTVEDIVPLFVTKWIDYSNKYGLGFQLSDRSVGVLFNDNTKISYTHDRRRVEYMTTDDEMTRYHRERDVPAPLQKKLELLRHFTEYMDDFLTEGGELKKYRAPPRQSKNACVPRMRRWLRTDKAIVMELTVPLLQVNFFVDHTKMVVSQESAGGRGYLITYIDTGRHASSYWLNDLRDLGCTPDLYERLYYVCKVTREFAELDNNTTA
ncbi:PREDICTED: serine/threonine-protein kinase PLK1-like isoform X2 [Trachymyrmex septentrionalis]|uniref:serine/threonine-protein kinase PLK1-like isoform X2 n=1 Tax=Trachymyrmex septentrionalis TaxID=34720 RepID=UPI00084F316B|nr:PREDICTED: serine/threonine-protein kinase PLK1-like isoform X2 [Trachymyrmex septentrionalis]